MTRPALALLALVAALGGSAYGVVAQDRASRLDEVFHGIAYRSVPDITSAGERPDWTPSPHDPDVRYRIDGQVHRSTDGGSTWTEISPVLTSGGLASLAESPLEPGLLWAGGSDGSLHLTRDGGVSWETLLGPDPTGGPVRQLVASAHEGGTAYVVVGSPPGATDAELVPLLFRVEEYGTETLPIVGAGTGLAEDQPVTAFAEDPGNGDLLFVGTPGGVHVSFNGAAAWDPLRLGMPEGWVTGLRVEGPDLVVDTREHGRFVLDEIAPLRHVVQGLMSGEPYLFEPSPVYVQAGPAADDGDQPVAYFDYLLPSFVGSVRLEVLDGHGRVLATLAAGGRDAEGRRLPGARAGVHRLTWDLSASDGASQASEGWPVAPGAYTLRMSVDGLVKERALEVVPVPPS